MGRYRVLVAGKNNVILDDLFKYTGDTFELMTTSMRYEDMDIHLSVFQPDIFIYCPYHDAKDDILRLTGLKRKVTRQNVTFVIVGDAEDCDEFQKLGVYMVDLVLTKPISVEQIRKQILQYMEEKEKEEQETEEEKIHLERVKEEKRRKHVLVIDDDPKMLKLMKEYLHENYDIATAISGRIARKFLENKKTDLILLDYEMPVENGPQVLETLRNAQLLHDAPVLFLTGITDREKIKQALLLKPQGYLLKPIDREKLLGTIEKFIG